MLIVHRLMQMDRNMSIQELADLDQAVNEVRQENELLRDTLTMIRDSLAGQQSAISAAIITWCNTALAESQ